MSSLLVLDNYDSFTYNLVHILGEVCDCEITVARNDQISLEAVARFDKIVLSPGPGLPNRAGIMPALIARYASEKSILGVCLGHQAIAESFGGQLKNLEKVVHGEATLTQIIGSSTGVFSGLPSQFDAGRYHSWVVDKETLPDCLEILAISNDNQIMALKHKNFDLTGLQFHPESVLTEFGPDILRNWINL
jgi:anthranilate synthase component 2